jgi:hypothetical protein
VKGIIVLGGFTRSATEGLVADFKSKGATIINTHNKPSVAESPFLHLTAALHMADKMCKDRLVVIPYSWVDVFLGIMHTSQCTSELECPQETFVKALNAWVVKSRILDRLAIRLGAFYYITPYAESILNTVLQNFSARADTLTCGPDHVDVGTVYNSASIFRCLHPDEDARNLNGNILDPSYLLVGDRINRVFKHLEHWPFHDDRASAFFLTSVLQHINVPETTLAWANANHESDSQVIVRLLERCRVPVVALGNDAKAGLSKLGIRPDFHIPHPSWARRFNKRNEYILSVTDIFKQDNSLSLFTDAMECPL